MTSAERAAIRRGLRQALSAALREFREQRRVSQNDLSLQAGLDRSYWGDLERGERTVTLPVLWQLAEALGISPSRLVMAIDKHYRKIQPAVASETPKQVALKRLQNFMDRSKEMKWLADPRQKTIYCNPPLLDYLGMSQEEIAGLTWRDLIHPHDLKKQITENNKAYAQREPYFSEYRLRGEDGQFHPMQQHVLPQFVKGSFFGMLGTIYMSASPAKQRDMWRSLEIARKHVYDFMAASSEMKWFMDREKETVYCNAALLDYLETTQEELRGQAWSALIHPEDLPKLLDDRKKAFPRREPFHTRYRIRHGDRYEWIDQEAVPQSTQKGVFIGYIGTMKVIPEPERESR